MTEFRGRASLAPTKVGASEADKETASRGSHFRGNEGMYRSNRVDDQYPFLVLKRVQDEAYFSGKARSSLGQASCRVAPRRMLSRITEGQMASAP